MKYHPFQNHYTHEIIIFELFGRLQLQPSGVFRINYHYSYSFLVFFFCRMELQETIPLRNSQEFSAITVIWFNGFRIRNVMVSKRMVVFSENSFRNHFVSEVGAESSGLGWIRAWLRPPVPRASGVRPPSRCGLAQWSGSGRRLIWWNLSISLSS